LTAWYDTWDDSTSPVKGQLLVKSELGTGSALFTITSVTSAAGYYKIGVTYISGILPTNATVQGIVFSRTGNLGACGVSGVSGVSGTTGTTGAC